MTSTEHAGSLRMVRQPVEWGTFDLVDDDELAVRIYYVQSAGGRGSGRPNADIAEVVVIESWDAVAITLVQRVVSGTYPDGAEELEPLAAVHRCLELVLADPLGTRRLVDGWTGTPTRRLRRGAAGDGDDGVFLRAEQRGCPRWIA